MAEAHAALRDILDVTECSICRETLTDPKGLPCIHTFCLYCLQTLGQDCIDGDALPCPLCRKEFLIPSGGMQNLPNNNFVGKLLLVNQFASFTVAGATESKKIICDVCDDDHKKPASDYCIECNEHLCADCTGRHRKQKCSKAHQVLSLKEKPSPEQLKKISVSHCDVHPNQEVLMYCYDCRTTICLLCHATKHTNHRCAEVDQSAQEFQGQLKNDVAMIKCCALENRNKMAALDFFKGKLMEQVDEAQRGISTRCDQLRASIDKQQKELMQELNAIKEEKLKVLATGRDETERDCVIQESFSAYGERLVAVGTACDVSRAADDIHKRAAEILKLHEQKQNSGDEVLRPGRIDFLCSKEKAELDRSYFGTLEYKNFATIDFISNSKVLQVIPADAKRQSVAGITLIDREIFILRNHGPLSLLRGMGGYTLPWDKDDKDGSLLRGMGGYTLPWDKDDKDEYTVEVYNLEQFKLKRSVPVGNMRDPWSLVACPRNMCLYIADSGSSCVERVCVRTDRVEKWNIGVFLKGYVEAWEGEKPVVYEVERLSGLSVTARSTLLVCLYENRLFEEYSADGNMIRKIKLPSGFDHLQHAIELPSGLFVISHSGKTQHRVCIVDEDGKIVHSYGGSAGSAVEQLCHPRYLAVDSCGNILVADSRNHRVVMLSPTLRHLGYVATPGHELRRAHTLCLDELNGRMFISEWNTGSNVVCLSTGDANPGAATGGLCIAEDPRETLKSPP